MNNPFKQAVAVQKKLKVLLYGAPGSGKTVAALSWPNPAVVDAESSTDMYRGRPGFDFTVFDTKNISDLEKAIQFVREDNGKSIETLVIDPITVFYDVLKEATARASKTGELGYREWSKINNRMKGVYNSLTNLPVHVVVIAAEATEYETVNGELRKTGQKPDSDKALSRVFDFVVRMNPDHSGVVLKSRGTDILGEKSIIKKVNWSAFEPVANQYLTGVTQQTHDDERDIEKLAEEIRASEPEAAAPNVTPINTNRVAQTLGTGDKGRRLDTTKTVDATAAFEALPGKTVSWEFGSWPKDFIDLCRKATGIDTLSLPEMAQLVGITGLAGSKQVWSQVYKSNMTEAINAVVTAQKKQFATEQA
jgi:hypothetical protein